jgi:hypothetical protein
MAATNDLALACAPISNGVTSDQKKHRLTNQLTIFRHSAGLMPTWRVKTRVR